MALVINAVFKGGGAKGVAYAGALRACEEADIEFAAVAGSSAGAITALLVACGYDSDEITERLPAALRSVGLPTTAALALTRSSLLSAERLRRWLDEAVRAKIDPGRPPTFSDIREATGIDLYVVTTHVATGQPVVFSPDLTPAAPVVGAVVASSAIPVVFRPGRIAAGNEFHRLIDGGAWANYPAFVFTDREFRSHHNLPLDSGVPTYGFVLGDDEIPVADLRTIVPSDGPSLVSDRGAAARELGILGALVSSPMARVALVLVPFVFALLALDWLRDEATNSFPTLTQIPDAWEQLALVGVVALLALGIVLVGIIAAIALRLGAELPDSGLMGVKAALGVGPSVPYWIGSIRTTGDHVAVRIAVPEELGTLSFRPQRDRVDEAIQAAHAATRRVLDRQLPPPTVTLNPPTSRRRRIARSLTTIVLSIAAIFATVALSLSLVRRLANGSSVWWLLPLVAIATTVLVVLTARRRAFRARHGTMAFDGRSDRFVVVVATVTGLLSAFFTGSAVLATGYSVIAETRAELIDGEVVGVEVDGSWSYLDVKLELEDDDVAELVRDPRGSLRSCDQPTPCVTLSTPSTGWASGDVVDVRADVNRGVAFLDSERWSWEHWNAFPSLAPLAFFLGALCVDATHTMFRRTQLAHAEQQRRPAIDVTAENRP